jgi:hypothetical protein
MESSSLMKKKTVVTQHSTRKQRRDMLKGVAPVKTDPDAFMPDDDDDDDDDDVGLRSKIMIAAKATIMEQEVPPSGLVPSSIKVKKSSDSLVTSSTPGLTSTMDMSMTEISAEDQILIVRSCVKKVFSIWKFYVREYHSQYSRDEKTMCGFIMKQTNIRGDHNWWLEMRRVVVKTHTDLRNNAIKNMQTKFKGKEMKPHCLIQHLRAY